VIQPSPFPSVAVVVAARHLQAFSAIRPAQLHVVHQGWSPALLGLAGTPGQLIGHVLLNDVPAGQTVPAADIGPAMPRRTVALAVTLKPAESLAASIGPGDTINVIPVCTDEDPPDDRGSLGVGVGVERVHPLAVRGLGRVGYGHGPRKARRKFPAAG
jgi:hypothetical protein